MAAGEGARMGDVTEDLPKAFLDINGKKIYQIQIEKLAPYCDTITIVLGYGFDTVSDPATKFSLERIDAETSIRFEVIDEWQAKENAYTARCGLREVDDDVLLVCGDVIFTQDVVKQTVDRFYDDFKPDGFSAVGVVEGIQDEMTAVRWDEDRIVTDYGAIKGHQEIGMFALNSDDLSEARTILENNPTDWFPIIFQELPAKPVAVSEKSGVK